MNEIQDEPVITCGERWIDWLWWWYWARSWL